MLLLLFFFSESPLLVIAERMFSKKATFLHVFINCHVSSNVYIMSCRQSSVRTAFLCQRLARRGEVSIEISVPSVIGSTLSIWKKFPRFEGCIAPAV